MGLADDYTAEQIESGIVAALKAHDMPAVVSLLKLLAVRDPGRAQIVYDTLQLGLKMSGAVR